MSYLSLHPLHDFEHLISDNASIVSAQVRTVCRAYRFDLAEDVHRADYDASPVFIG